MAERSATVADGMGDSSQQLMTSSPRRRGPITPGIACCGRPLLHRRKREHTAYGSPPSRGRQRSSLHPSLRIDRDEAAVAGVADGGDAVDARAVEQAVLQGEDKIAAHENAVFHRRAFG